MKIYFSNQQENFDRHLRSLISKPVMDFDKSLLEKKTTSINVGQEHISNIDLRFFFSYNIFPASILTFKTQWQSEDRKMRVGDTIVQQVFIPPIKTLSQKLIFGVRINNIIDEPHRKGFSYETLEGHVERGESTFVLEQHDNALIFKIQTYSEPSNSFVKIFASWAALPYQRYCTRRALQNVKRQIEGQTPEPN
jgi:hypothetical protein